VTNNFFVHSVEMHFTYCGDDAKFLQSCRSVLPEGGPTPEEVLKEVKEQRERRLRAPTEAEERAKLIAEKYVPLHKEIYAFDEQSMLSPEFLTLVNSFRRAGRKVSASLLKELEQDHLLHTTRRGIFTFPVLKEAFCDRLEDELKHFLESGLPHTAPNTMNRFGIIMAELGFGTMIQPLVQEYVDVLATALLPNHTKGLDSYRAFTVLYDADKEDGDKSLAMHYDNSEVTLNINIGGTWQGGSVDFYGLATELDAGEQPVANVLLKRGHAVFHAGWELHQAQPVCSGRRHNLILWCRSSGIRNHCCPMCSSTPRVIPTSLLAHEGFTVPPCRMGVSVGDDDDELYD